MASDMPYRPPLPSLKLSTAGFTQGPRPSKNMLSERDLINLFNDMNLGPRAIMRMMISLDDDLQPEPEPEPETDLFGRPIPAPNPSCHGTLTDAATAEKIYAWSRVLEVAQEQGIGSQAEWIERWYAADEFWSHAGSIQDAPGARSTLNRNNENNPGIMTGGDSLRPLGPRDLAGGDSPLPVISGDLAETALMTGLFVGEGDDEDHDDKDGNQSTSRLGQKNRTKDLLEGVEFTGSAGLGLLLPNSAAAFRVTEGRSTGADSAGDGDDVMRNPMVRKRRKKTAMELCFPKALQHRR